MAPLFLLIGMALISACGNSEKEWTTDGSVPVISLDSITRVQDVKASDLLLMIDKSERTLEVWYGNELLKRYKVVLGTDPVKDKRMEGDRRTPEGHFGIRDMYPHAKWSRFIWLDYPTADSWEKHRAWMKENDMPPTTSIGGEIGIHGVPEGRDDLVTSGNDWTWGCISLTNKDVEELYRNIDSGTAVEIVP